tara:strand:- start:414 stop:1079 length:666 start_codon:yes stop_codon:yes gene_type:complete
MSKIFSNGCSFLTLRPKDGVNTFVTRHLADLYGMDIENIAMGGRGNTRISFSTKTYFEHFGTEDTFAVIGWSSAYRNDYITNDGWKKGRMPGTDLTWRTWKTLDNVSFIKSNTGWDIENNATMAFLDNVFDLQNYFERKGIPYVMYNALPNSFDGELQDFKTIKNAINMERFFNPTVSHLEYITDKNLIVSPADPHPSTEGHVQWAEQLKEFIDVNNLRTI